ncbi:hypothetical protein ABPG72_004485 [Tetrahymena utriculariae]
MNDAEYNSNEVQYNYVGKQVNRSYKLPSYESQQKTDNSDFELESPLREQQNRNEAQEKQKSIIKLISATQPLDNHLQQKDMITYKSLNMNSLNKENNQQSQGSFTSRGLDQNEFLENLSPTQIQQNTNLQSNQRSQIHYQISVMKKKELERIQENDDEKVNSSMQIASIQQSRDFHSSRGNQNLQDLDGKIKDTLNANRFKDLQNLLEESKNQLKNDLQVILNGLETDQLLIQSKINDLQDEYNAILLRKSQNQQIDEERFLKIEKNLKKQINYLQALRYGLQQSQKNMQTPFQNHQIQPSNSKQAAINSVIKSQQYLVEGQQQGNHNSQMQQPQKEIRQTVTVNPNRNDDMKQLNKTEAINSKKIDEGTQTENKSNHLYVNNNIYNVTGNQAHKIQAQYQQPLVVQQYKQIKLLKQENQANDRINQDFHKKNIGQNEMKRQEIRKQIEIDEQKINNLKQFDIDFNRKTASRQSRQKVEIRQINQDQPQNHMNSRSKQTLSNNKTNNSQAYTQEEQNKQMLLKRLNNRKEFQDTIKEIFQPSSKNRNASPSPENQNKSMINQSNYPHDAYSIDKDKERYQTSKTSQRLDLNDIKILPRDPIIKQTSNQLFNQRTQQNKTPDSYQSHNGRLKRLDQSYNYLTPKKDFNQGNKSNNSYSMMQNGNNQSTTPIQKFNQQYSQSSINSNNDKQISIKSQNNLNSSKDSINMSQILSKYSLSRNRQKRAISYLNPLEETQNSYLNNQCSWKSKVDYMDQVKQKYKLKSSPENWKKIANDEDIDSDVKIEQLKQFSKMLSIKAKRKLQLSRVKSKNSKNEFFLNEDLIEADDLIINSIKAKLAIIDTVNRQYDQQISEQGESLEQSVQNLDIIIKKDKNK